MKLLSLILLSCILLSSSCNKDKPSTDFYFQCKVDGIVYKPDNCANCETKDFTGDTSLILGANMGNEALAIGLIKSPSLTTGSYNLANPSSKFSGLFDNTIGNPSDIFRTDSIRTGVITITELDKANKIIVGTFNFDAFNIPQNKVVRITEGKFRLNYKAY